jgi:hypothetical protein
LKHAYSVADRTGLEPGLAEGLIAKALIASGTGSAATSLLAGNVCAVQFAAGSDAGVPAATGSPKLAAEGAWLLTCWPPEVLSQPCRLPFPLTPVALHVLHASLQACGAASGVCRDVRDGLSQGHGAGASTSNVVPAARVSAAAWRSRARRSTTLWSRTRPGAGLRVASHQRLRPCADLA